MSTPRCPSLPSSPGTECIDNFKALRLMFLVAASKGAPRKRTYLLSTLDPVVVTISTRCSLKPFARVPATIFTTFWKAVRKPASVVAWHKSVHVG